MTVFLTINAGGRDYRVDLAHPRDISIPVRFDAQQLSVFGTPPAQMNVLQAGDFVGAVARGGSCNCETYTITPHGNGTHTECVGHITAQRLSVHELLRDSIMPATLITVRPAAPSEHYDPVPQADDLMITRAMLTAALAGADPDFLSALIVRTVPNDPGKTMHDYHSAMPAYFSHDAMAYIAGLPVRHLLVDMPSVDRLDDGGRLGNHRLFWSVAPGDRAGAPSPKTITELIFVPDAVPDGRYVLNLQVAAFDADAAPSRPVLYEVTHV